ncbi:MAG: tRNA-binding protein [Alphaproteobacteria bacterium]|nr:tRNA-binding protein [Alphaproteobacteria bacterium]
MTDTITFDDFLNVDIRSGKIIKAEPFPEARKPAYKLQIDFGPQIGIKKSSAQITENYTCDDLVGKNIMAVVNFPPRQIGPVMSEVLVLGFYDNNENVELVTYSNNIKQGQKLM